MDKHVAKFYGNIVETSYYLRKTAYPYVESFSDVIDNKLIWEGELDQPLIKEDEIVYIPTLNAEVRVNSRVRNVEGGHVYYTDYMVKGIVNEESKIEAEKELETYIKTKAENIRQEEANKKKWYQFWK